MNPRNRKEIFWRWAVAAAMIGSGVVQVLESGGLGESEGGGGDLGEVRKNGLVVPGFTNEVERIWVSQQQSKELWGVPFKDSEYPNFRFVDKQGQEWGLENHTDDFVLVEPVWMQALGGMVLCPKVIHVVDSSSEFEAGLGDVVIENGNLYELNVGLVRACLIEEVSNGAAWSDGEVLLAMWPSVDEIARRWVGVLGRYNYEQYEASLLPESASVGEQRYYQSLLLLNNAGVVGWPIVTEAWFDPLSSA